MREDEKLVAIEVFEDSLDAEAAKEVLAEAGIESVVVGNNLVTNMIPGVPSFAIELQVCQSDVERAKQILKEKEVLEDNESNE